LEEEEERFRLVAVIVVVIIPVVIGAPAMGVFIPPAMFVLPAVRTGFGKFLAPMLGLGAIPAVMLGGFMEFMIRMTDAFLAVVVRAGGGGSYEYTESC
jgi:hypothetical protein